MRTAIYVYETSELSIHTSEAGLELEAMDDASRKLVPAKNPLTLPRGVYQVRSSGWITVSVESKIAVDIVTGNDQDEVPTPRPKLMPDPRDIAATELFKRKLEAFFSKAKAAND